MAIWNKLNNNDDDSTPAIEKKSAPITSKFYGEPRPLVSSAARINLNLKSQVEFITKMRAANRWQEDAWSYYDLVGEIKQAATLLANVTSRVRLYPAFIVDRDAVPSIIDDIKDIPDTVKDHANSAMMLLASGNGGVSGLLRDAALNLFIAGECFLVREPARPSKGESEKWTIRSISEYRESEISTPQGRVKSVSIHPTKANIESEVIDLPPNAFVGRIWRSHPQYSLDPDSSMLGILELLDELLLTDRLSRSTIRSRMNNGVMLLPDELDNNYESDGELTEEDAELAELSHDVQSSLSEELMDALLDPIRDESSSAANIPVFLRGGAAALKEVRHIGFSRPFDPMIAQRNEKIMERIMTALDLPKDVMAGFANLKYSNAIVIEESLYKAHVEPLILMIVDALTVIFLRPVLRGLGVTEDIVSRITIWYDPSAITAKPDKATAATQGYTNDLVSGAAWRRENGFSESDGPTQLELAQKMAIKKGLLSEPITEALLSTLIPDILGKVRKDAMAATDPNSAGALEEALSTDGVAETTGDPAVTPDQLAEPAPTTETPTETPAPTDIPDDNETPPTELINP